jgi:hypothetical protein
MKKIKGSKLWAQRHVLDSTMAAMERMELYCTAHPRSPSTVRRPRLLYRGELWVALLGPSVEEGIIGIGQTVEGALRAFDVQYLAGLRPRTNHSATNSIIRNVPPPKSGQKYRAAA